MNDFDSSTPRPGSESNDPAAPGTPVTPVTPVTPATPATPPPRRSFGRRNWGKLTFLMLLGIPLLGLALWAVIGLNYTYSTGTRSGVVQKISRKGWLCKTWEGTLYTSVGPVRTDSFNFTVRDDSVAKVLEELSGKRVAVQYDQHNLVPTNCFGDTEYYVSGVEVLPQ